MPWLSEGLRRGIAMADRSGRSIGYRYLMGDDDLTTITAMLHDAYAPLAAAGMRFMASHQDVETTGRRAARGETIVATDRGGMVGIITLAEVGATAGTPFYDRTGVAGVGQFAVRPSHQRQGIGSTLLDLVERRAREKGVSHVALDTSEHAAHLIALYEARGYRFVECWRWSEVNYRSVILAKELK